jgi:hypothetical protein
VTLDPNLAVTLYKDSKVEGESTQYKVGEYPDLGGMHDEVSSLRIPQGLKVTLYEHTNFEGKSLTLEANDHQNLKHFARNDYNKNWGSVFGSSGQESLTAGQWYGKDVCYGGCWNDTASSMKVYPA